jgi:hypothetical protein
VGLIQNTSQCANGHLVLLGNNRSVDDIARTSHKFHMAAFPAYFHETSSFEPALDFSGRAAD